MSNENGFLKHVRKTVAHLAGEYGVNITPHDLDAITDSVRQVINRDRDPAPARECEAGCPDENVLTEGGWQ